MINGKRIGLTLGSGGARGLAHIGVLQVLEENGIRPDMVAGCSAGAIFGAIYAAGTDLYLLGRFAETLVAKDLVDPTLPQKGGLLNGEKVRELVRILTHNLTHTGTRIPFYCTAVDLQSGEQKVFDRGLLCDNVRASMAVPGVFTPARVEGRWYGDGGILEELPVKCLRERGADIVLTSDLGIKKNEFDGDHLSAVDVLNRSFSIMQEHMTAAQTDKGDVVMRPDASFMGLLLTSNAAHSVEEGRKAAMEALPRIRTLLQMEA